MGSVTVKRTDSNYGNALSGRLGSEPRLEEEYVRRLVAVDASDGVTSLREAILTAYAAGDPTPAAWQKVANVQRELVDVKERLLAAGYTMADLLKLTLDNSDGLTSKL